jgi:hypothetical protein
MHAQGSRMGSVVSILANLLVLCSLSVESVSAQSFEVIASGLDNPRGLAFGPAGALYVVEAGRGGDGPCTDYELYGNIECFGFSGAVTRIWQGRQERIVTGLHSLAHPDSGNFAFGPHDISFQGNGVAYVVVGGCFPGVGPFGGGCGELIRLQPKGTWKTIANLLDYEVANNPDGSTLFSDPYGVLALPGRRIVVDAAANTVLRVTPHGEITTLAVLPARLMEAPDGSLISIESVPTSAAQGPDGALYVGELSGDFAPVGSARVYRIPPGGAPQVYAEGFTTVIDIAFDRHGRLLVLEIAKNSLESGDQTGALIRLNPDGSRETLLSDGLKTPTAVAVGADHALYISNCGTCGGVGEVIRVVVDQGD